MATPGLEEASREDSALTLCPDMSMLLTHHRSLVLFDHCFTSLGNVVQQFDRGL